MMAMNLEQQQRQGDDPYGSVPTTAPGSYEMYRTESPAPFTNSPGMYTTELPGGGAGQEYYATHHQHHQQQQHAHTVPATGMYVVDGHFNAAPEEGYYSHPQHATL